MAETERALCVWPRGRCSRLAAHPASRSWIAPGLRAAKWLEEKRYAVGECLVGRHASGVAVERCVVFVWRQSDRVLCSVFVSEMKLGSSPSSIASSSMGGGRAYRLMYAYGSRLSREGVVCKGSGRQGQVLWTAKLSSQTGSHSGHSEAFAVAIWLTMLPCAESRGRFGDEWMSMTVSFGSEAEGAARASAGVCSILNQKIGFKLKVRLAPAPPSVAWASGSVAVKGGSVGPIGQNEFPLGNPKMDTDGPVPPPSPRPNPSDPRRPSQNLAPRAPRPVSGV
eukprot:scaffold4961_cov114-Isochrysis_galbana.AAC.9